MPNMRIGIGIPTKDRPDYLAILLVCLLNQTWPQWDAVIVDDGGSPLFNGASCWSLEVLLREVRRQGHAVEVIPGARQGPPQAHNLALQHLPHGLILRLDDDQAPCPDFLEKLCAAMHGDRADDVGAVGGVYPFLEEVRCFEDYPPQVQTQSFQAGFDARVQCSLHRTAAVLEVRHLHSSYLYRRDVVKQFGFPTCYSPVGHREETETSLRIRLAGYRLLVVTDAIAWHFKAPTGGIRSHCRVADLRAEDELVFRSRCLADGLDPALRSPARARRREDAAA